MVPNRFRAVLWQHFNCHNLLGDIHIFHVSWCPTPENAVIRIGAIKHCDATTLIAVAIEWPNIYTLFDVLNFQWLYRISLTLFHAEKLCESLIVATSQSKTHRMYIRYRLEMLLTDNFCYPNWSANRNPITASWNLIGIRTYTRTYTHTHEYTH